MPNWCWNVATISHTDTEKMAKIKAELAKDKPELFNMLRPRPPEEEDSWYMWNCEYWGTKWDASVYDTDWLNDNTLKLTMDTAWSPPLAMYHFLFEEGYDVEAYYHEEGMAFCGKYDFGNDEYYEYGNLDSEGIRENIPTDIDELFGLSERAEEREEEESEDLEDENAVDCFSCGEMVIRDDLVEMDGQLVCPHCTEGWVEEENRTTDDDGPFKNGHQYETTDWYPAETNPVREGRYEVMTNQWPLPQWAEWNGIQWELDAVEIEDETVTQWRGLTEWQHDMNKALDDLKEEFDRLVEEEHNKAD